MRIGIVSPWFERGLGYAALMMYQALSRKHEMHVLTKGSHEPVGEEWQISNLTNSGLGTFSNPVPWAKKHKLEALIFNERHDFKNIQCVRNAGIKTVGLHMWETISEDDISDMNKCFDANIAPTECAFIKFQELGLDRVFLVPWGADLDVFYPMKGKPDSPTRFFHPAGFGGVKGRRGTKETKIAFSAALENSSSLLICSQRGTNTNREGRITIQHGTVPRPALARLYRQSDVALLPSRWEGIGLTFLEALASGLAIVTVKAPPMSEYVMDRSNGFLCECDFTSPPPRRHVAPAIVDKRAFMQKIEFLAAHPDIAREMGKHSRALAEEKFDWAKNSIYLLDVIEEIDA